MQVLSGHVLASDGFSQFGIRGLSTPLLCMRWPMRSAGVLMFKKLSVRPLLRDFQTIHRILKEQGTYIFF